MSTTMPPCESAFLQISKRESITKKSDLNWTHLDMRTEIFTQVPAVVDRGQICGGGLQLSGERSLISFKSLEISSWCHLISGCLLQLLRPCDHVLLLRPIHSWGERQVISCLTTMAIMRRRAMVRKSRMVISPISMAVQIMLIMLFEQFHPGRTCGGRSIWQYYRCNFIIFVKIIKGRVSQNIFFLS